MTATRKTPAGKAQRGRPPSPARIARAAADQLADLLGREPDAVVSLEEDDGEWTVELEVVETRRIPATSDVLAVYRVQMDADGELRGYQRVHRYVRGQVGRGGE